MSPYVHSSFKRKNNAKTTKKNEDMQYSKKACDSFKKKKKALRMQGSLNFFAKKKKVI